jgi:hypothetical protein
VSLDSRDMAQEVVSHHSECGVNDSLRACAGNAAEICFLRTGRFRLVR